MSTTDPNQNFHNPIFDGKRGIANDTVYREYISITDQSTFVDLATKMNNALHAIRGKPYPVQRGIERDKVFGAELIQGYIIVNL